MRFLFGIAGAVTREIYVVSCISDRRGCVTYCRCFFPGPNPGDVISAIAFSIFRIAQTFRLRILHEYRAECGRRWRHTPPPSCAQIVGWVLGTHRRPYYRAKIPSDGDSGGAGHLRAYSSASLRGYGASVASVFNPSATAQFRRFRRPTQIPHLARFGGFVFFPILVAGCGRLAVSFVSFLG